MKMNNIMKQAQKMQAEMARIQKELENETVEGNSGGGMVKVVANGQGEIRSISIEPEVIDAEEKEMLEDLVLAAINDALQKSRDLSASRMGGLAGGLGNLGLM